MIRILHTADWHLGQHFFGYDRTDEQAHFLSWLVDEVQARHIDVLIIAGDVFDVSNPSAASQRMFYRFIREIHATSPNVQLVIIAGNHDSATRLEAPVPLLHEMNTVIKGTVRKQDGEPEYDDLIVELKNNEGTIEALCLTVPFLRQGDYPSIETEGNPYAEGVKALYTRLIAHALQLKTDRQALVAVGHLQATGSEIAEKDYSERTIIGGLECVSPDIFSEEVAYTALGHIHKAQRVSGREHVRYAGSPLPMSFAEKHYRHGVVQVTLDEGKLQSIEKVDYAPLVGMITIPPTHPALSEEVELLLEELSETCEATLHTPAPYLEVKVLLDEPEPMLRHRIESAIANKHVRLARIVSTYRTVDGVTAEEEIMTMGLQEMNPLQIAQATFEKTYHTNMPDELVQLFHEAMLSLNIESERKS